MNIDSSSLLSLLSSAESLDKLQHNAEFDGSVPQEFADTLIEKIRQLTVSPESGQLAENFTTNLSDNSNRLHGIAGLLNEKGTAADFSSLFGKSLPINKLEKDINLENTLEALANVINTLEDVVLEELDLKTKIEGVVDKIEIVKELVPEQVELTEILDEIAIGLQKIKDDISNNEGVGVSTTELVSKSGLVVSEQIKNSVEIKDNNSKEPIIPLNMQKKEAAVENRNQRFLNPEKTVTANKPEITGLEISADHDVDKRLIEQVPSLVEQLDKVVDAIKQLKERVLEDNALPKEADLENQIALLATEIESIKAVFVQNKANQLTDKKELIIDHQMQIHSAEEEVDNVQVTNQIAAIAATLNEPQEREKVTVVPVFQELKPEIKKETLSLKQMTEERVLGVLPKTEPETLLQQENAMRKPGQDNPVIVAKQNEKADFLDTDGKKIEASNEKVLPKFATDIANLNRSIMFENKAEIPPMTKHFAHPEWNKEISERVIWMHKQEIPSAELRLNPRHLGPITIKVDVTQEQATVAFTAQHAAVKEAIEAALPKLREMFSAQQLNLAEVNVSQDDAKQKQPGSFAQMEGGTGEKEDKEANEMINNGQAENTMEIADEIEAGRAIASNGILSIFA